MIITPVQACLACFLSYTLKAVGKETLFFHQNSSYVSYLYMFAYAVGSNDVECTKTKGRAASINGVALVSQQQNLHTLALHTFFFYP